MTAREDKWRERLLPFVAILVLIGWSASLTVALLTGEYAPLTAVTPLMLLLAGYAFGASIVKSAKGGGPDA